LALISTQSVSSIELSSSCVLTIRIVSLAPLEFVLSLRWIIFEKDSNIVLVGDLNSNLFCVNNNNLVDIMNTFVFKNVIDKPTRVTENSSTLLDPIILSDSLSNSYKPITNTEWVRAQLIIYIFFKLFYVYFVILPTFSFKCS
jgi:hypothetical protein